MQRGGERKTRRHRRKQRKNRDIENKKVTTNNRRTSTLRWSQGQRSKRRNPAEPHTHTTARLTVRGLHQPLGEWTKMERPERE